MSEANVRRLTFDMRGQICPSTLLRALEEINEHAEALLAGEVSLSFLTDNRDATVTIPDSAENMGYACTVKKEKNFYRIDIVSGETTEFS